MAAEQGGKSEFAKIPNTVMPPYRREISGY